MEGQGHGGPKRAESADPRSSSNLKKTAPTCARIYTKSDQGEFLHTHTEAMFIWQSIFSWLAEFPQDQGDTTRCAEGRDAFVAMPRRHWSDRGDVAATFQVNIQFDLTCRRNIVVIQSVME